MFQVMLVHQTHKLQVLRTFILRLVVQPAPVNRQKLALLADTQWALIVNKFSQLLHSPSFLAVFLKSRSLSPTGRSWRTACRRHIPSRHFFALKRRESVLQKLLLPFAYHVWMDFEPVGQFRQRLPFLEGFDRYRSLKGTCKFSS